MADVDDSQQCANCAKAGTTTDNTLKRCAKCKTTLYCSRDCQKSHWKTHKKVCASNAANATSAGPSSSAAPSTAPSSASRGPPPKGLTVAIDKPFHRLNDKTWLHNRPEQDVYKLLIDCYRLRMEDDYNLQGEADEDSIYGGATNGGRGFQRFLSLAQSRRGLFPSWWSEEKASACMRLGMRNSGWSSLSSAVEKSDIVEHYGDPVMPMQLRMLGEQVYGRGPGGQPGAGMMKMQMMMEGGESGMHFSNMSLSFRSTRQFFNGQTQEDFQDPNKLGINKWVDKGGIIGRGILLDWASWATRNGGEIKPLQSGPVSADGLKAIIKEQNIQIRSWGILFIRIGFTAAYNALTPTEQENYPNRQPPGLLGLEATHESLKWLWESRFAAVASDSPSLERRPTTGPYNDPDVSIHQWPLAGWGLPLGEMFDLEELAETARRLGEYSFFSD